jgi:hypothetical protein
MMGMRERREGSNVGEGEGAAQRYDAEGATSGKGRERHSGAVRRGATSKGRERRMVG